MDKQEVDTKVDVPVKKKKELTEQQREFLAMIESKIRRAEKETWLLESHDHLIKK
jgi:hypothetical protein